MRNANNSEELETFPSQLTNLKHNSPGNLVFLSDLNGFIHIKSLSSNDFSSVNCNTAVIEDTQSSPQPVTLLEVQKSSESRAFLLSSLEKCIEIWKISPDSQKSRFSGLRTSALSGVHDYTINSISMCQNSKNFLSSDDLNVYFWDLCRLDQVCHLVDHKETAHPSNEVITCSGFHPSNSYEILWASTNGSIRIGDLRSRFLMDRPTIMFKYESSASWYFEELVASISHAEFCRSGFNVIARDYFTVKVWDLRNTSSPALKVDVVESQSQSMNDLYQSQALCADFEVRDCYDSQFCLTGGYGKVVIINTMTGEVKSKCLEHEIEVLHIDYCEASKDIAFTIDDMFGSFNIKNYL